MRRAAAAWVAVVSLVLAAVACGRSSQEATPGASPATPGPSASASPVASAVPSASGAGASAALRSWKGTYKTTPSTLAVLPEFSKTHWTSNDTTTGVGEGAVLLSIDPSTHRVTGTLDGVAGPAILEGQATGTTLTAAVRRKDPADKGLAGTLLATVAPDKIDGTLKLATGDGAILRTGTLSLAQAAP